MGEMDQPVVITNPGVTTGTGHEPKPEATESAYLLPDQPLASCPLTILSTLTDKQRAVLDLLIDHKTSKEISRLLGISPHTVDQRIMLARAKLGVASRSEVAQAYRRLVADSAAVATIYERSIYDFSDVAPLHDAQQSAWREDKTDWQQPLPSRPEAFAKAALSDGNALTEPYHHVLPEMFDGPYGTYVRLGTIAAFAMFLILIVLGGLAMYAQLSQIIDH